MYTDHPRKLRVAIVIPAKKFLCLGALLWTQRYGALQVASLANEAGFFVRIFNEELGISVPEVELARDYDVVGFSCKSSALPRAEQFARRIKQEAQRRGRRVVTVLGGEHACMCGGNRLDECFDYVLPGESEEAFLVLLKAVEIERTQDQQTVHLLPPNPFYICKTFDNVPDLSLVSGYDDITRSLSFKYFRPLWTLKHKKLPMLCFQATRGCPYKCAFCPTPRYLQGPEYRRRSFESALKFLKDHMARSGIRKVFFEDPNAAIPFDKLSYWFFDSLAKNPTGMKATVLVRTALCRDTKLLEAMKAAGVVNLSIGIESLNEQTRHDFNKGMSHESIVESIDIFHRYGFTVTGLFIVGYDADDLDSFTEIEKFILKTGIEKWKVSPLTQMLELSEQFMPAHRFFLWDEFASFDRDVVDYGNGEFVLFYPKHMTPSALQKNINHFNLSSTSTLNLLRLFLKRKKLAPVGQRIGNNLAQRLVQRDILASGYLEMMQELEPRFYSVKNGKMSVREDILLKRYADRGGRSTREVWGGPRFGESFSMTSNGWAEHDKGLRGCS